MNMTETQAREFLRGPSFKTEEEALAYLKTKDDEDQTLGEMFGKSIERFVTPHKLAAQQIGSLIAQGIEKAKPAMDLPIVPIGMGNSLEMLTPRTALKRVEPIISTLEVIPETIKQTFRNVVLPLQGKKDFDPSELMKGLRLAGRRGSVFGELTKTEGKVEQFSFLPDILKEMDVPKGVTVNLPGIGEVSQRGVIGLIGEILLPSLPGFGIAKARRTAAILEKGVEASASEVRFAQKAINDIDQAIVIGRKELSEASRIAETITEKAGERSRQVDNFLAEFDKPQKEVVKSTLPVKAREDFIPFKISARKADIAESRKLLGLDEIPNPERKSWEQSLSTAKSKKLNEKALRLSDEVLDNPRAFNDEETAGVTLKRTELMNEHNQLIRELRTTTDPAEIKLRAAEIERVESEFDRVDTALRMSGTEKGRALASQKMTINQDYSLVAVKTRAKALAGKPLTKKQQAAFDELVFRLEEKSRKVDELERFVMHTEAENVLKASKRQYAKVPRQQIEKDVSRLANRVKQLIDTGCKIG